MLTEMRVDLPENRCFISMTLLSAYTLQCKTTTSNVRYYHELQENFNFRAAEK